VNAFRRSSDRQNKSELVFILVLHSFQISAVYSEYEVTRTGTVPGTAYHTVILEEDKCISTNCARRKRATRREDRGSILMEK
jgi:hypothetical protein